MEPLLPLKPWRQRPTVTIASPPLFLAGFGLLVEEIGGVPTGSGSATLLFVQIDICEIESDGF
ncbi:hypothetical protein NC652_024403 [Populus alba x Populus x berolinensis]|nr:hypothetical protein NC652_024403 [Populus alba x Populus x berolinensis]